MPTTEFTEKWCTDNKSKAEFRADLATLVARNKYAVQEQCISIIHDRLEDLDEANAIAAAAAAGLGER